MDDKSLLFDANVISQVILIKLLLFNAPHVRYITQHPTKKRVHLPNGLHSDKSAEKNFEFRRLLLHVGTRSLIRSFHGFIQNWSAARCMVPKKKSTKNLLLLRWTAKGDKIVTRFLVQEKKKKEALSFKPLETKGKEDSNNKLFHIGRQED